MSETLTVKDIPFIPESGNLINLGPSNPSALKRLANYAQIMADSGEEIPESEFIARYADLVTEEDKQDLIFFLSGRRGSGKSYSFLYIGKRFAEAIARRKGGKWQDYFSLDNCALLEDSHRIMQIMKKSRKHQVILIDDVSVGAGAKNWNTQQNKNLGAIVTVCRTNRWILLLCAPLKKQADNTLRELTDLHGVVHGSFHEGGFNILKINKLDVTETGKDYRKRLKFPNKGKNRRKVDFYVTFRPDPGLATKYDIQRSEAALCLNARLADPEEETKEKPPKKSVAEKNVDKYIEEKGAEIKTFFTQSPGATINGFAAKFIKSPLFMERVLCQMGLSVNKRGGK